MRTPPRGTILVLLLIMSELVWAETAPTVAIAEYQTIPRQRIFDAYIEAKQHTTVSAQTSGRVAEVRYDVGEYVSKGDIIIRFRGKEQGAALDAAIARVEHAKARYAEAETEYIRIKDVHAKKLVSKAALDKASAEIKTAHANLKEAEANVKEATEGYERTVVRAPYSGVVVKRHIDAGESARVGDPLMTGLSMQNLRAIATIPQAILNQVLTHNQSNDVKVILPNQDNRTVASKRMVLVPCNQPVCTAYTVRVDLAQDIEGIFPGMLVKVEFTIGEQKQLLVPAAAIVNRSEVTGVYVVSEHGRISLRQIRTGKKYINGMVAVLAGLSGGEKVAVDPLKAAAQIKAQQEQAVP